VHCNLSNIKKLKIAKFNLNKVTYAGERISLNTTPMTFESSGGCKNWLLVVDEFTDMKWNFFLKNKSDVKQETMLNFLTKLQDEQVKVKFI
jgi:hypothetical protein